MSTTPSVSPSPSSLSSPVRIPSLPSRDSPIQLFFPTILVGFVQEQRSEQSLEALNRLVPHHCHIIRDGEQIHVLANELITGDLVAFTSCDRVPADVRLLIAADLQIDESNLAGETTERRKDVNPCPDGTEMANRACIAYMGTLVRNGACNFASLLGQTDAQSCAGRGAGIVIATGSQTEFGIIFNMVQDVEERCTPLQHSMDELAKKLSMLAFAIIGVICLIGAFQHRPWLEMFI
jgi:P-type Ca2+ transporter type 2C